MTRGPIPRFDLYEELEVSRLASVEVIEAAYRSLVKRHHPDVSAPTDPQRITRLNLAREWLVDASRRRRYDDATGPNWASRRSPGTGSSASRSRASGSGTGTADSRSSGSARRASAPGTSSSSRAGTSEAEGTSTASSARASSETSFGANTPAVRQFLSDLRAVDRPRARQIWDGRAVAHSKGYTAARRRAMAASREHRHGEWQFAREAASVIARGKLGDSTLTAQVQDVVADIAGALTIRDLISRADFELLLLPWTWRGDRLPLPAHRPVSTTVQAHPSRPSAALASSHPPIQARASMAAGATNAATPAAPPIPATASIPAAVDTPPIAPRGSWTSGVSVRPIIARVKRPSVLERPLAVYSEPSIMARIRSRGVLARAGTLPLLYVVVAVAALGVAMAGLNRPPGAVADERSQPTAGPSMAVAGVTSPPRPSPSARASTPPLPIDAAQLRELQRGAARTVRALTAAAAASDVATAQVLVGTTAPGLQASGLRAASFPEVQAADVVVARAGSGWTATAGVDRLVSLDGSTWTFDYADRPLARLTGGTERELFWTEADGRHGIQLRIASATVTTAGLAVRFAWQDGSGAAVDRWFKRAEIVITSVTLGTRSMPLVIEPFVVVGANSRAGATVAFGEVGSPSSILVQVSVRPQPGGTGAPVPPIETMFEMAPA